MIIMMCFKCYYGASPGNSGRAVREGFLEEVTPEWHLSGCVSICQVKKEGDACQAEGRAEAWGV